MTDDRCCTGIEAVITFFLAVMVVLVFGNVVLRYGFNSGITVSEEVSRWLFIWVTFLGAVVALKEHGHLGVDMVVQKLPPAGKKFCLAASHAVMLYIVWLLFQGSLAQAKINLDVQAPVTGAPVAIFYSAGIVFAIASGALLLYELWLARSGRLRDDELVMVKESEEAGELEALQAELARENAQTPAHVTSGGRGPK